MRAKNIYLLVAVPLLVAFFFCGEGFPQEPIKVGYIGAFTGVAYRLSKDSEQAADLAVEEINAAGGLLGRRVEMLKRDGGARPELHARLAREAVEQDKVVALFGGGASSCTLGASAVAKETKIPYLVSVGNSEAIVVQQGHPFVFLFEPNSTMEAKSWSAVASKFPQRQYVWLGPDYEWGRSMLTTFKEGMKKAGIDLTWKRELWHKLGETDFTSYIQVIMATKPEVLFSATWGSDMNSFLRQAKGANMFNILRILYLCNISEIEAVPFGLELPRGLWGYSRGPFYYLAEKYPLAKQFSKKYYDKFKEYPGQFSVCSYDAVLAWAEAVRRAKTVDPPKIADSLKGLKFSGLRGQMWIRPIDGQATCSTYFGVYDFFPEYPAFAIMKPVVEVEAQKLWKTEDEVKAAREKK